MALRRAEYLQKIPLSQLLDRRVFVNSDRDEEIDDIVQSLSRYGQLHPIIVREHGDKKGKYEIIAGSRRYTAAKKLGWDSISAEVVEASDTEALIMTLIENEHRRDFTDYERALLIERLRALTRKTYAGVAELIGKSNAYVSQHVAMLHLFPDAIASEEERKKVLCSLTEGHARALLKIEDTTERWNTAKLAVKANLGIRELEKECRKISNAMTVKRTNGTKSGKSVQEIVRDIIAGLNAKDLRPLFEVRSAKGFSFFSSFPPFDRLESREANDHVFNVISQMDRFKVRLVHAEVVHRKETAVAILGLQYEIKAGGKTLVSPTRATLVFFKEGNEWRIAHEHWSTANDDPFGLVTLVKSVKITR